MKHISGRYRPGKCLFLASILLLFLPPVSASDDLVEVAELLPESVDRPKIGLALSGGGARGGAHVGVLKALEDMEIPIDFVAGTSMGAIIGGFYAAGYSPDEIEDILKNTDWERAMRDRPDRVDRTIRKKELEAQFLIPYRVGFNGGKIELPLGAIEGQHLDQLFHEFLLPVVHERDFMSLPIPFNAVATDLVTGEEVVISEGSLPDALRASMSVPGIFAPVRLDDRLLVDGGMANNLPVSVVRDMGADVVIAVDISSPLLKEEQLKSILSVTEQLTNFLVRRTTEAQIASLGPLDVLITPALGNFSAADFEGADTIIHLGEDATRDKHHALHAMRETAYSEFMASEGLGDQAHEDFVVQFVEIDNRSVLNDEIIRSRVDVEPGKPLDIAALNESMDRIYSLDVFESVTYDFVDNEEGEEGVRIRAFPRSWGPNYLQFGLELSSDFSGASDFKLGAAYTRNALNRLGGELRTIVSIGREDEISFDFYQPVDTRANWFVQPQVYWRRENYNVWDEDINIAELEIAGWGVEFAVGRNFSTTDRLKLEYEFARADADVLTGTLDFPFDDRVDIGELKLEYLHDTLDSLWFPTQGFMNRTTLLYASESLGAAFNYEQIFGNGIVAKSWGRHSALFNYEFGYSFDDAAPLERWFNLGGFGRLSGLIPDQLRERHAAMGTLAYYYALNQSNIVPAYAGFTLEAGNVWTYRSDIGLDDLTYSVSIFAGAETPIGPVYVALGHHENGDNAFYFYVGNPFRVSRFE